MDYLWKLMMVLKGLVHVSEIDWTNNNPNPHKIANVGDQIEVMILGIDKDKRRVSLGIKAMSSKSMD